jgi:UDP-N-acetylmuramoylalanine-D-glutamate ligase
MDDSRDFPLSGRLAYVGPPLGHAARYVLEGRGFIIDQTQGVDEVADVFAASPDLVVLGSSAEHTKVRTAVQTEAGRRNVPCVSDLTLVTAMQGDLTVPATRRVLVTGSAGKTSTAALLQTVLGRQQREVAIVRGEEGYLNALGRRAEIMILIVPPSQLRYGVDLSAMVTAVLNFTEEGSLPVGQKAREAAIQLLAGSGLAVIGADDPGAQGLMMELRRRQGTKLENLVPVSGGATLADGCFTIERTVYSIRHGRTRRVADVKDSAALVGDHFGQDCAAVAAISSHLGLSDEQIAEGLLNYRGLSGRFDFIGTDERLIFVDDRHAVCGISTVAAIAACPDVFWIGHRTGDLPKKVKAAARGFFYLAGEDGSGPPVDGVVTFSSIEAACQAAFRAARDLLRREPRATPVILFSPGSPGYEREGEAFRVHALEALNTKGLRHG